MAVHRPHGLVWRSIARGRPELNHIDYTRDVRPILSRACYVCHGPDAGSREAELRLDRADTSYAKNADGIAAIVPGDPQASELMRRITSDGQDRMPPETSGHQLKKLEIETLEQWIREGAKFDDHWSFRAIVRPNLPPSRMFPGHEMPSTISSSIN